MQRVELHAIQASVLRQLFLRGGLRFADINVHKISNDHFSYHLRQLIKHGLIEKRDEAYELSITGKEWAIRLSSESDTFIDQGLVALRAIIPRDENGRTVYLVQKRTKVPFKGAIGLPGGKILYGEDVTEAARRAVMFETGLDCTFEVRGMAHLKERYEHAVVQDKYFFVVLAKECQGEVKHLGETGENLWLDYGQIGEVDTHNGLSDLFEIGGKDSLHFKEATFTLTNYT